MFNKKLILFVCLLAWAFIGVAQTITVKKEKARIKNKYADGFQVALDASMEEAESALNKFMKTLGKTKEVANYFVVNEPLILGKTYKTPVYGQTRQLGNIISVWVGLDTDDWGKDAESVSNDIEKMIHDFGVSFHRDKIQKQVDESVRASEAVEKQQQRLNNQNRDLSTKIEDNKREKIQLEKSFEKNKLEFETLSKRLEKNKKDQDSVAVAGEQIKKVIELHKERQRKVN